MSAIRARLAALYRKARGSKARGAGDSKPASPPKPADQLQQVLASHDELVAGQARLQKGLEELVARVDALTTRINTCESSAADAHQETRAAADVRIDAVDAAQQRRIDDALALALADKPSRTQVDELLAEKLADKPSADRVEELLTSRLADKPSWTQVDELLLAALAPLPSTRQMEDHVDAALADHPTKTQVEDGLADNLAIARAELATHIDAARNIYTEDADRVNNELNRINNELDRLSPGLESTKTNLEALTLELAKAKLRTNNLGDDVKGKLSTLDDAVAKLGDRTAENDVTIDHNIKLLDKDLTRVNGKIDVLAEYLGLLRVIPGNLLSRPSSAAAVAAGGPQRTNSSQPEKRSSGDEASQRTGDDDPLRPKHRRSRRSQQA